MHIILTNAYIVPIILLINVTITNGNYDNNNYIIIIINITISNTKLYNPQKVHFITVCLLLKVHIYGTSSFKCYGTLQIPLSMTTSRNKGNVTVD